MAKFNLIKENKTLTLNKASGYGYKASDKLSLVSLLLNSFVEDQYYRTSEETLAYLKEIINSLPDKKFIAKAAIFARNEFGMRSISHATAAELAYILRGQNIDWKVKFFDKVIRRVDDSQEILAYYISKYGRKGLPNALKKGIARALARFDEYQLSKYKGENKDVSLVDVVNLCHVKPTDKNKEAFYKLVHKELKNLETWETKLTQAGQNAETDEELKNMKAEAWKDLVLNHKLGYMALLRNLRNIAEQADPEVVNEALKQLVNIEAIKKSLILPFRFFTAYKELSSVANSKKILNAISEALDLSVVNVPKLTGRTLIAIDQSGSMEGKEAEISSMLAAILLKSNDADLVTFDDTANFKNYSTKGDVLTIMNSILENFTGGGTNFESIFKLIGSNYYDRIIILSDMQAWGGSEVGLVKTALKQYKKNSGADPYIYSYDLAGYGTLSFPENKVYALAGFNPKIFDIMSVLEQDKQALINTIEKVEL